MQEKVVKIAEICQKNKKIALINMKLAKFGWINKK